jgi:hypothetical protein
MVEARQVPEIAVLAERKFGVSRASDEAGTEKDRDGPGTHRVPDSLAARPEHAADLSLKGSARLRLPRESPGRARLGALEPGSAPGALQDGASTHTTVTSAQ